MILDRLVELQRRVIAQNDEGLQVEQFIKVKTIKANIQPFSFTNPPRTDSGPSALGFDTARMYCKKDTAIEYGMRIVDGNAVYDVKAVNHWNIHTDSIIVPVQGGQG